MVNSISNGEKLGFYRCYIHYIMNRFGNNLLISIDIWDQSGYIVFDTSVWDDEHDVLIYEWVLIDVLKSVTISS